MEDGARSLRFIHLAITFGVGMAVRIGAGYYGGNWLDQRWDTGPAMLLLGVLLGIGLSFYGLVKQLEELGKTAGDGPNKGG